MTCLTPGTIPPFDAGALDGGPFHGGCIADEECNIVVGVPRRGSRSAAPPTVVPKVG